MNTEPIVTFRNADDTDILEKWEIGKINAGAKSEPITVCVWNNRGGETDVAHMQDTKITTTDGTSDTLDVVANQWVYAKCLSAGDAEAKQIGGVEKVILTAAGDDVGEGEIHGIQNTGIKDTDTKNFAEVELYFQSELHGVTSGERNFSVRVEYFYV